MPTKLTFDEINTWIDAADVLIQGVSPQEATIAQGAVREGRMQWVREVTGNLLLDKQLEAGGVIARMAHERRYGFQNLQPSLLALHGLNYVSTHGRGRYSGGMEQLNTFRGFLMELVPEIGSVHLGGRVAKHVMRLATSGTTPATSRLFDVRWPEAIMFKGTIGTDLNDANLVRLAGGSKTGEMTLRLFAGLSDSDLAGEAYKAHPYRLATYSD